MPSPLEEPLLKGTSPLSSKQEGEAPLPRESCLMYRDFVQKCLAGMFMCVMLFHMCMFIFLSFLFMLSLWMAAIDEICRQSGAPPGNCPNSRVVGD